MRFVSENLEMSSRQVVDAGGISNGLAHYLLTAFVQKAL